MNIDKLDPGIQNRCRGALAGAVIGEEICKRTKHMSTEEVDNYTFDLSEIPEKYSKTIDTNSSEVMRLASAVITAIKPQPIARADENNVNQVGINFDEPEYVDRENLNDILQIVKSSFQKTGGLADTNFAMEWLAAILYCSVVIDSRWKSRIAELAWRLVDVSSGEQSYRENWIEIENKIMDANETHGRTLHNLDNSATDSLSIAIWGLLSFDNFLDGLAAVIQLGGDTVTNATIYGQVAGVFYGYDSLAQGRK